MKFEQNWKYKSIESLEKKNYGHIPDEESGIVQRLWRLRKLPLNEFQVDDIRFMIIQGYALNYMLLLAIDLLKENLLIEGNYYEGDLLNAVLQIDKVRWSQHKESWMSVDALINGQLDYLRTNQPKLSIDNFYNCRPM